MRVLDCTETSEWQLVLDHALFYDFYHMSSYNLLEAKINGYEAKLLVYEEGEAFIALPLILRPLSALEGLPASFAGYYDATSVYGYAGSITNQVSSNHAFFRRFGIALDKQLSELCVVTAFTRLHPIIQNDNELGIGEVVSLGETVSINLTLSLDDQMRLFRKSHRYEIRKARAENTIAVHDTNWDYFDDFFTLYIATMQRVNAHMSYHFKKTYFEQLRTALGEKLHLFAAIRDNKVISAALFTLTNNLVQYHLAGSSTEELNYATSKLVLDEVRQWGHTVGANTLHLGGGLGSRKDNLFLFKSGFSPDRHKFKIWRYVADKAMYKSAIQSRREWLLEQGLDYNEANYFPLYRCNYGLIK